LHGVPGQPSKVSVAFAWQLVNSLPVLASELIGARRDLIQRFRRKASALHRRFLRTKSAEQVTATASAEMLDELVDMSAYPKDYRHFAQVHFQALLQYVPRPYAGKLTLFRTRQQAVFRWNPEVIWNMFASSVDVEVIPGTHEKILEPPCVDVLAQKLSQRLEAVQSAKLRAHAA
jgi:thioesterase domain-containing protein